MSLTPKVYYFTGLVYPVRIANRTTIMKTSEALSGLGMDITLFVAKLNLPPADVFKFYRVLREFSIRTLNIKTPGRFKSLAYAHCYKDIYIKEKPDVVYIREPKLAVILRFLTGRELKFIYELHNEGPDMLSKILNRYLLPRAQGVIFITKSMEAAVLKKYPYLKNNSVVAPMGFEPSLFAGRNEMSPETAKHELGLSENTPIALYVGSTLDSWKGFQYFVEAAGHLSGTTFVAIGGNEASIQSWKNYARERNIGNIIFVGYLSDPRKLFLHYKAASVLVSTTNRALDDTGDSPMKIFEYMGSCRPIVAMEGIVVKETLHHNINAVLVPERDGGKLAEAIGRVVGDSDQARRLAMQAMSDVNRFTWTERAKTIKHFIETINAK